MNKEDIIEFAELQSAMEDRGEQYLNEHVNEGYYFDRVTVMDGETPFASTTASLNVVSRRHRLTPKCSCLGRVKLIHHSDVS